MDNQNYPYKKWLNYAQDDLSWTEANIKEQVWYGACFTAQQAAEKALKAFLISQEENIKKIHDLRALLEECIRIDQSFEQLRENCAILNAYYAPSRYPDIAEFIDFTQEKAKEAYLLAKKIVDFVQHKLESLPPNKS